MLFIDGEKKPVLTGAGLAFVRRRYSDAVVFLSGKIYIWSGKCLLVVISLLLLLLFY